MKIKLFTIPNFITLSNLVCGVLAINEVVANQNYTLAFWFVILASIFDFFDGFVARLLSQQSPIGVQLDSLSDLISFGLAPAFMLFSLAKDALLPSDFQFLPYVTLVVVAFSALRLAKFNIDESQSDSFEGLPTPANALLCMSLGLISELKGVEIPSMWVVAVAVVMSIFMLLPLRMFSLKFKGFGWAENRLRYSFLLLALVEIVALRLYALPVVILSYLIISIAKAVASRGRA